MQHKLQATLARSGHEVVVTVTGEVDIAVAEDLNTVILEAFDTGLPTIIDLRGVSFCDSTGLKVLLRASRQADMRHVRLTLRRPLDDVAFRVFELTKMDAVLPFEPAADGEQATGS